MQIGKGCMDNSDDFSKYHLITLLRQMQPITKQSSQYFIPGYTTLTTFTLDMFQHNGMNINDRGIQGSANFDNPTSIYGRLLCTSVHEATRQTTMMIPMGLVDGWRCN